MGQLDQFAKQIFAEETELDGWLSAKSYDPIMRGRKERLVHALLESVPEVRDELVDAGRKEGLLAEARDGLRRVLARRKLVASGEDQARIVACTDIVTLHRWLDQAIDAPSAAEALR